MHIPVLLQEVINNLNLKPNDNCLDATVGAGGHAHAMLSCTSPAGKLWGFDRDRTALMLATQELKSFQDRFIAIHDSFANLDLYQEQITKEGPLQAIVADLGVSSMQLDISERGFSFRLSSPLDMRFDQNRGETAADVLNSRSAKDLQTIFSDYGEVRFARTLAQAVVNERKARPFHNSDQLVALVEKVSPFKSFKLRRRIHPATTVFQALRLEVNHELDHLKIFLPKAISLLSAHGRLAIISFHSLEDRLVKNIFKTASLDCICPPEIPQCRCNHRATVKIITKKPIVPTNLEIQNNPRARSAKLRLIEKI
ncbi:MAG: 16S rRNA (cytosine(1402)-N(4))-methyltransferase [Candidatus Kerfeldbacteria bacterium RIFOXYA2_FULL_38_24]|uniref:Ribosomal RNA small subunit methyltransferase H n=1 Tax=Candidatus Kerfeldbacteria bacterium RIFOXYB2_FULL_38_14 TaxID=1798547 RepID=A0A1G2BG44_9BACT|nr:MAG: 16S rRNA (cytosine(1402)-N(4))-methyltransferase [Candidatus Kerfeldbacteria bacterium RIFOXYA2_FULL_38_24]OGY88102.1 MAG: 16S rRNA (cytosine(1402)-N(4))-methyltransferase [Candidatus Kerfeldbacteria bacterium RIFOXYB2_FULL_38_14]OGY88459.1 MAG: 16S rRNA (cytosine(1402)-N(4))-methyltransferase [Candidatus Kerfeldbacteria bacterium RIFOXYC2_FULL_38_9]